MPWIAGALVPNSPWLLPKLANQALAQTSKTRQAIMRLGHELHARQPDIIVMLAVNQELFGTADLLQAPSLPYSFAEYGDVISSGFVKLATGFTHALKERTETSFPLALRSPAALPLHFGVPCVWLQPYVSDCTYVFLELSPRLTIDELSRLSVLLAEHGKTVLDRLVIVAAGNLARTTKQSTESIIYNKYFLSALEPLNKDVLLNIDADLRLQSKESLWAPAALLSLILAESQVSTEILSYEAPGQIGYVVAQFNPF